ncbi:hypothetical protein [Tepidibacter hydrothermalis]|uniref:Uncharacterized protein n=1 Tax=Tepidibacter hydrothermalis TaxID=3036126 RepID=A0ABY8EJ18_9FIRM|nr:hypothetical protein [Tepidibacter hydrothermalis]WFD12025.1 hypothetical protein P4S50_08090 [Tepidibacter hydrothermalis]
MPKRKIIPVSIASEKILKHLETKENVSKYIRDLIKNDIEKKNELDPNLKEVIEEYIRNNFKNLKIENDELDNGDLEIFKGSIEEIFDIE